MSDEKEKKEVKAPEKQPEVSTKVAPPVVPKKSHKTLWIVLIVIFLFLALTAGGIYLAYKFYKNLTTKSLTIPDNCPKNIPIYPKSKILKVTCKPEASSIESIVSVDQNKVKAWYKTAVEKNGWTIRGEDSASYLFDNPQEIGKVSLSTEKKKTAVKFLTAKRTATVPAGNSSFSGSAAKKSNPTGLSMFDALFNWESYFNSITPDYSSPTDEGTDFNYDEPADSGSDEVIPEDLPAPTDEATAEPEATPDDTSTTDPGGDWNDKYYLQVPTDVE